MSFIKIIIYCDGGIGNRINSLISGLAVAKNFNLNYQIHWPLNNWCAASFDDIFSSLESVSTLSLKDLRGQMDEAVMLLHDELASTVLGCDFTSAYSFTSFDDFSAKVLSKDRPVFFYPALIPDWIPTNNIHEELKNLAFSQFINEEASKFMREVIQKPYHGIHLRRTDLNVGLTDLEVQQLVIHHRDSNFYVCSDDPMAEALVSAHPHVHSRQKNHQVEKKTSGEWTHPCTDDDGRVYFGNIQRSRESVIEASIDLLILAHSQIVGYSGSTFQRMAKMIGDVAPLIDIERPPVISYFSLSQMTQQIERQFIDPSMLILACQTMVNAGQAHQALDLMRLGFEHLSNECRPDIAHELGVMLLNQNHPRQAYLYFNAVLQLQPKHYSSWLHLAFAKTLLGENDLAQQALLQAIANRPETSKDADAILEKALTDRFQINPTSQRIPKDIS